jgi:hypothetical protein
MVTKVTKHFWKPPPRFPAHTPPKTTIQFKMDFAGTKCEAVDLAQRDHIVVQRRVTEEREKGSNDKEIERKRLRERETKKNKETERNRGRIKYA